MPKSDKPAEEVLDDFDDIDLGAPDGDDLDPDTEEPEPEVDAPKPAPRTATKPAPKPASTPAAKPTTPAPSKEQPKPDKPAPKVSALEEITFIEFGTTISRYVYNRFKAQKDTKTRICVLTNKVVPMKTHFHKGIGSYVCFEGKCCDVDGFSKLRYCIPVVVYETDRKGNITSKNLKIEILAVGQEKYQELIDLSVDFPITQHDIIVSCSDEQYQKYSFAVKPDPCAWKKYPTAQQLVDEWKEKASRAYECVARKMDAKAFAIALGRSAAANSTGNDQTNDLPAEVVEPGDAFEEQ